MKIDLHFKLNLIHQEKHLENKLKEIVKLKY